MSEGFVEQIRRRKQASLNTAFQRLRAVVPSHPLDKKLCKQAILRLAINYICVLQAQLDYLNQQEDYHHHHHHDVGPTVTHSQISGQIASLPNWTDLGLPPQKADHGSDDDIEFSRNKDRLNNI